MFGFLTMALPALLFWVLVAMAVLWFLRALNNLADGLREVSERLASIEEAIRHRGM